MDISPKYITLKNGCQVLLRGTCPSDAATINRFRRITSGETPFMARYPEEITADDEEQRQYLQHFAQDDDQFMLGAFLGERLIGHAGISRISGHIKYRHRGIFGISIIKEYWGLGLGTQMTEEMLNIARSTSFDQIELGVFANNTRAIALYEKAGFRRCGVMPRAFRLKDGSCFDEIQMVYLLR